jgi:bla regulator protein blaR1
MDKITWLTVLTSLAAYHVLIGMLVITVVAALIKWSRPSAESQSWLWVTVFFVVTCLPFTMLLDESTGRSGAEFKALKRTNNPSASGQQGTSSVTWVAEESASFGVLQDQRLLDLKAVTVSKHLGDYYWHIPSQFIFRSSSLLMILGIIWLLGILWRTALIWRSVHLGHKVVKSAKVYQPCLSIRQLSDVQILSSDFASSPMVVGLLSPKILLPTRFTESLSEQQLRAIVLHEQAHIERLDLWVGFMQKLVATLFWWSPVIRIIDRKIHISRELACDARAARVINSGKEYAQSLLDCARLMITQKQDVLAMSLFSKKKELNHRVSEALKLTQMRKVNSLAVIALCSFLGFVSVQAAQLVSPKVNFYQVKQDAKPYHYLPSAEAAQVKNAVSVKDSSALQSLVEQGVDLNRPVKGDGTALIMAVKQGDRQTVESLLALGVDVNQAARGDGNPLIIAAMLNRLDLAKLLLAHGASVDAVVIGDETALINAAWRGHFAMTQLLVDSGADVNLGVRAMAWDGWELRSPLSMAKTQQIRDYLVSRGATE